MAAEERLFRFGVIGRALDRNKFRFSVRAPNPGVWPPICIGVKSENSPAYRRAAWHRISVPRLYDVSEKCYSVREGCRVNNVLVCPERMMVNTGILSN